MVVAVVNSKGGVGKSTLAVHAAAWLYERGRRVAVIDADAQGSTADWLGRAVPAIRLERVTNAAEIIDRYRRLEALHDVVVVDGPAALSTETVTIVGIADLALMPIGPSMMDVIASYRTARVIYKVRFNPKREGRPRAFVVLNRVQPRTRLARIAAAAIIRYGFPVANHALQLRQAYAEACGEGTLVWRMGARGSAAAEEIRGLFEQVLAEPALAGSPPSLNISAGESRSSPGDIEIQ